MNNIGNHIYLVGSLQDNGEIKHIKAYTNVTWAIKEASKLGVSARFAEVEVEWTTDAPTPRAVPVKINGKSVAVSKEVQ